MTDSISPITMLPTELLTVIFVYCLPEEQDVWFEGPDLLHAPLLTASVCRLWREVVLQAPLLWRTISFGGRNYDPRSEAAKAKYIDMFATRSGTHPLRMYANLDRRHRDCVRRLFQNVPRCEHLKVHLPPDLRVKGLLPTSPGPLLKTLVLTERTKSSFLNFESGSPSEDIDLSFATGIENLFLCGGAFSRLCVDTVSWTQLTSLKLESVTSEASALRVVARCTALKSCALSFACEGDANSTEVLAGEDHLELLELEDLCLGSPMDCGRGDFEEIAKRLTAPKLKRLELIAPCVRVHIGSPTAWISMIQRSHASVHHLELQTGYCPFATFEGLMDVLSEMPDLETLSIKNQIMQSGDPFDGRAQDFLQALTRPFSDEGGQVQDTLALPSLSRLAIRAPLNLKDPAAFESVERMLRSRCQGRPGSGNNSVYPNCALREAAVIFMGSDQKTKWDLSNWGTLRLESKSKVCNLPVEFWID
ncbi:hypothetical protein OE88DRAFT_1246323 [Heliocybe sulcata]|uniref:Uncharacterized protein n=1 Tax=Heliocybe sulcata TaxID=5364 RepID=A0A5C3NBN6_9AGAM|nr:hypothetical protein OE88DRAFT_1246323 [Heliocybe sulcata]